MVEIGSNVQRIFSKLPEGVGLVAATKSRSVDEILEAIDSGVTIIGENYVQEAERKFNAIGRKVKWHLIGHLQKNKVKKAVKIFDIIETVDSAEIAEAIDKVCNEENKIMSVLIEINSGREKNKSGVLPEDAENLIKQIAALPNTRITGLMTMGPALSDPEAYRPYFRETKNLFDRIKTKLDIKYLSMGMSDSYNIAIQEGANIVRIGTGIFGRRLDKLPERSEG